MNKKAVKDWLVSIRDFFHILPVISYPSYSPSFMNFNYVEYGAWYCIMSLFRSQNNIPPMRLPPIKEIMDILKDGSEPSIVKVNKLANFYKIPCIILNSNQFTQEITFDVTDNMSEFLNRNINVPIVFMSVSGMMKAYDITIGIPNFLDANVRTDIAKIIKSRPHIKYDFIIGPLLLRLPKNFRYLPGDKVLFNPDREVEVSDRHITEILFPYAQIPWQCIYAEIDRVYANGRNKAVLGSKATLSDRVYLLDAALVTKYSYRSYIRMLLVQSVTTITYHGGNPNDYDFTDLLNAYKASAFK